MCDICRHTKCDPRCPNADNTAMCYCKICGYEIYVGDTMDVIEGMRICEECVFDAKTTAEVEDYDDW